MMRYRQLAILIAPLLAAGCEDIVLPPVPEAVVSVEVVSPAPRVIAGGTLQLAATVLGSQGAALSGRSVVWSSSDTLVASVTQGGLVSARRAGSSTITATSEGRSGHTTLTVDPLLEPVAVVRITPQSPVTLRPGETFRLEVVLLDAEGLELDGREVVWSSSAPAVASVAGGEVSAHSAGDVVITATSEGRSSTAAIRVVEPYPYDLLFDAGYGQDASIYRLELHVPGADAVRLIENAHAWDVSPSPDGSRIAFTCTNGHTTAICVAGADGSGSRVLTPGTDLADQPAWSPDGTRIAFRRWSPGGPPGPFNISHIWVMRADGSEQVPVTGGSEPGSWQAHPTWSPRQADGSYRIAYSQQSMADGYAVGRIYSLRADGSDRRAITAGGGYLESEPSWSPDGKTIVFVRTGGTAAGDLWLVSPAGGNERPLMSADPADDQASPAWSPDGKLIAFASRHEVTEDNRWSYQIYTVRPDGSELERRTHRGADRERPAWLPRP